MSRQNMFSETQVIEVRGDIVINSDPVPCNGRLNATVVARPASSGSSSAESEFALEKVTVMSVRCDYMVFMRA